MWFLSTTTYTYFRVSDAIGWDIVENEIPVLLEQVRAMLAGR
jgi:uncharacterized protein with HEPN domain